MNLAIKIDNSSYPALPETSRKLSWGGARHTGREVTDRLTLAKAMMLEGAWQFSVHIGLGLNRHTTIHFGKAGIDDADAARVIGAFLKSMGDAIRKAGGTFAATWVRENGEGKGSHVHIFVHIPAAQWPMVQRLQMRWLYMARGCPLPKMAAGTLHGTWIRGARAGLNPSNGLYMENGSNVARYGFKGVERESAALVGVKNWQVGGTIIGKRCGTTQNIGRTAWTKAGWKPNFAPP